jgi:UDP-glucose 4-epimerase
MILVTGSDGYIGKHLLNHLKIRGTKYLGIDNVGKVSTKTAFGIERVDVLDKFLLEQLFVDNRFEAVIHLAALKNVEESFSKPDLYFETNVIGTKYIYDLAQAHEVKKFIFASSAAVYDTTNHSNELLREGSPCNPSSPYGESKLEAEKYILKNFDGSMGVFILRFFNVVGCDSGIFNPFEGSNIIPIILRKAYNNEPIKIFQSNDPTPDLTCIRDYIDVNDLVEVIFQLMTRLNSATNECETYNLGSGRGTSVLELVELFEKQFGRLITKEIAGPRKGEPSISISDINLISELLSWHPKVSIEQTVENLCKTLKE